MDKVPRKAQVFRSFCCMHHISKRTGMKFLRISSLLFLLQFLPIFCAAQITVNVSEKYSAIHYSKTLRLTPGEVVSVDIHQNDFRDGYKVLYSAPTSGLVMVLLDGRDRAANSQYPVPLHESTLYGFGSIVLPAVPSSEGAILSFVNRSAATAGAKIRVDRVGIRPPAIRKAIENIVALPVRSLNKVYELPNLLITVKPCGEVNAYSTPNIIVCSELVADLSEKDLPYALWPIIFHELGHSLLWIWKMPGYDSEEVVDSFAAAMLAKANPKAVDQYISWFESMDSVAEAAAKLSAANNHPLSIHRARALQKLINDPGFEMRKWDELLRPRLRK